MPRCSPVAGLITFLAIAVVGGLSSPSRQRLAGAGQQYLAVPAAPRRRPRCARADRPPASRPLRAQIAFSITIIAIVASELNPGEGWYEGCWVENGVETCGTYYTGASGAPAHEAPPAAASRPAARPLALQTASAL